MKIERLEFVCYFDSENKGIVKIDLSTSKVVMNIEDIEI